MHNYWGSCGTEGDLERLRFCFTFCSVRVRFHTPTDSVTRACVRMPQEATRARASALRWNLPCWNLVRAVLPTLRVRDLRGYEGRQAGGACAARLRGRPSMSIDGTEEHVAVIFIQDLVDGHPRLSFPQRARLMEARFFPASRVSTASTAGRTRRLCDTESPLALFRTAPCTRSKLTTCQRTLLASKNTSGRGRKIVGCWLPPTSSGFALSRLPIGGAVYLLKRHSDMIIFGWAHQVIAHLLGRGRSRGTWHPAHGPRATSDTTPHTETKRRSSMTLV
jgi:hypothetical protein